MPRWETVTTTEAVPATGGAVGYVGEKAIAVFRDGDAFFAIDDACPHAGASLATGEVADGVVTCPWHYWRFRLCDGAWANNPKVRTTAYPVRVVGNMVQVQVPD